MDEKVLYKLRYPIGTFKSPEHITDDQLKHWIGILEELPQQFEALTMRLSDTQLETPYRPGGWTVRQVVHHVSDSHHNSYIRFKWALTEDKPTIKAYDEKAWANLFDTKTAPIRLSLNHIRAVHDKLVYLLRGLPKAELQRKFIHPEGNEETTLLVNVGRYAWHGSHHLAHIKNLAERQGW